MNELDEATATALCVAIHNHIEMLKQWERKIRLPYYNPVGSPNIYRLTPVYPKPTTQSAINLIAQIEHTARDMRHITNRRIGNFRFGQQVLPGMVIDTEK